MQSAIIIPGLKLTAQILFIVMMEIQSLFLTVAQKLEIMNMGNSLETFVTEGKRIEVTKEKLGLNKVVFIIVFRIRQVCP